MAINKKYWEVVRSNVTLHSSMAEQYNRCEPHFRPENVERVENVLKAIIDSVHAKNLLDLGCGTGFIINIAKKYVQKITGIDVTQEMLDQVDTTGVCSIHLMNADTGTVNLDEESFDVVTAYSFLHHLYDIVPTLKTAFRVLRNGGKLYVDLEPNYYFWEEINKLSRDGDYDFIVKREIEAVTYKDEEIAKGFGVDGDIFNNAEYGKSRKGGFKEGDLRKILGRIGFRHVEYQYNWFIGQGALINDQSYSKADRFIYAQVMDNILQRAKPLSRGLYKYIGFTATR